MEITFDPKKAASNIIKHGISFDEAHKLPCLMKML